MKDKNNLKSAQIANNYFFSFVSDYFFFMNKLKFDFVKKEASVKKSWLTGERKYIIPDYYVDELNKLQFCYNNKVGYYQICNHNITTSEWFTMVKEFILFLNQTELSLLYKNDKGDSNIYVDCDPLNSSYILYYYDENKETEYRLSFMETDIKKPGTGSLILTFVEGIEDEETNITLIQLDILRRYGDKRTNQIKLIKESDNNYLFNNIEDFLTYNVFRTIISKVIYDTFNDILNNINEIVGFNRNITEEVLHGYIKL